MKQINLKVSIKLLVILISLNLNMGCVNCEDHLNEKIRPLFIKAIVSRIDTLGYPEHTFYYISNGSENCIRFYGGCGDSDFYAKISNISDGDSISKEIGTDIFNFKQKKGKIIKVKYPCCIM